MVKHTHTIRRQIADELFECVWPFCGLALKGLTLSLFFFSLEVEEKELYVCKGLIYENFL